MIPALRRAVFVWPQGCVEARQGGTSRIDDAGRLAGSAGDLGAIPAVRRPRKVEARAGRTSPLQVHGAGRRSQFGPRSCCPASGSRRMPGLLSTDVQRPTHEGSKACAPCSSAPVLELGGQVWSPVGDRRHRRALRISANGPSWPEGTRTPPGAVGREPPRSFPTTLGPCARQHQRVLRGRFLARRPAAHVTDPPHGSVAELRIWADKS